MQIKPSDIDFHIDGEINTSCFQHLFQKLQWKTTKKKNVKMLPSLHMIHQKMGDQP